MIGMLEMHNVSLFLTHVTLHYGANNQTISVDIHKCSMNNMGVSTGMLVF